MWGGCDRLQNALVSGGRLLLLPFHPPYCPLLPGLVSHLLTRTHARSRPLTLVHSTTSGNVRLATGGIRSHREESGSERRRAGDKQSEARHSLTWPAWVRATAVSLAGLFPKRAGNLRIT